MTFVESTRLALRLESAGGIPKPSTSHENLSATHMEIGNAEPGKRKERKKLSEEETKIYRQIRCFNCKREGCRPWKHSEKENDSRKVKANSVAVKEEDQSPSSPGLTRKTDWFA